MAGGNINTTRHLFTELPMTCLVVYAVKIAAPTQMYFVTYLLTSDVFMWLLAHTYVNTTAERRCRYFN